jgi:methylmalonyl-CoA mutase C-terminal domain/subunit
MQQNRIRILMGKIGLDGHDRGIRLLSTWLKNDGMEVVYLGTHNTADYVVKVAIEEDVKVIGLSFQGGDHLSLTRKIIAAMKDNRLQDVLLLVGGNIPRQDVPTLIETGVTKVFPSGVALSEVTQYIRENVGKADHPVH